MRPLLASLLVLGAATRSAPPAPGPPFEAAVVAASNFEFTRAAELYRVAARSDPDPRQRDLAALRLANIEWRIEHDATAAGRDLDLVRENGGESPNAWIQRARMAAELRADFPAAREFAGRGLSLATRPLERAGAAYVHAFASVEPVRRARLEGRCTIDSGILPAAETEMKAVVDIAGYPPNVARMLLDIALLSNDGRMALTAWRGYYGPTAESALLARPSATLAEQLPVWAGNDATTEQRRLVGLALADARFFTEAVLVLHDPCARQPLPADDPQIRDVVTYEAAIRKLSVATDEYYREVALDQARPAVLRDLVESTERALWQQLSWKGQRPRFSQGAADKELDRRFGAIVRLGLTQNVFDLHFGHRVVDDEKEVSQYGRTASLRFVALDGIISNGFTAWAMDGRGGDGGWTSDAIYQVRPLYATGPILAWLQSTSPAARTQQEQQIADESRHDDERVAADPDQMPFGVVLRLERQYLDRLLSDLRATGLSGDALRAAFTARLTRDTFDSSIWAHEGRHAIDKKYDHWTSSAELEYRAKLSEVTLGPAPGKAAESIGAQVPATSPHGVADRRIGKGLTAWMTAHIGEIAAADPAKAMLTQVDKLTDDQLRSAFRSLDPLANANP